MATSAISVAEFDRIFAESMGPYLRTYVAVRLADRGASTLQRALEDVYVGLVASRALVYSGERKGLHARVYHVVDRVLELFDRPALRRGIDPEVRVRARRFARLVNREWHAGFEQNLQALLRLEEREREAILLRDYHAMSMNDIAKRFAVRTDEARAFVEHVRGRMSESAPKTAH